MTTTDQQLPGAINLPVGQGESRDAAAARAAVGPDAGATLALAAITSRARSFGELDLTALHDELARVTKDASTTGTDRLLGQAVVLDRLFTHLATTAMQTDSVHMCAIKLKLALRAQAQCRATLEAVSNIRHPRQYVGTQNVGEQYNAGGHQQVNRCAQADAAKNRPTELSKGTTNELHPNGGAPAGGSGVGTADGSRRRTRRIVAR